MKHTLEKDFLEICKDILSEYKTLEDWRKIESDYMFQIGNYADGFDATENEFCFSVFVNDFEYWFQLSLDEIKEVLNGFKKSVELDKADY